MTHPRWLLATVLACSCTADVDLDLGEVSASGTGGDAGSSDDETRTTGISADASSDAADTSEASDATSDDAGGSTADASSGDGGDASSSESSGPDTGPDPADAVFYNGWENRDELGCSLEGLLDGPGGVSADSWNDFGPVLAVTCGEPPIAEIVDDEQRSGERSLRVTFPPDFSQNGPDFRIQQDFAAQTETYVSAWVKYSDNWVWASADHKILIMGQGGDAFTQDVYINVRGMGDGGPGYIAVHAIPADAVFEAYDSNVTPGQWHLVEAHIVSGDQGSIEVRLDGELLDFVDPARHWATTNVPTGNVVEYVEVDTTYNDYVYPSSLGLTMHTWFDDVAVFEGSW